MVAGAVFAGRFLAAWARTELVASGSSREAACQARIRRLKLSITAWMKTREPSMSPVTSA
jgi:hypothetical protein